MAVGRRRAPAKKYDGFWAPWREGASAPSRHGWRRASVLGTAWCPLSKWRRRRQCRRCHQAASHAKAKKGTAATDPVGHLAQPLRPPSAAGTVPPTPRRRLRTFVPHGPRRRGSICLCAESQMADPHLPRPQLPTAAHAATRCPAHIVWGISLAAHKPKIQVIPR